MPDPARAGLFIYARNLERLARFYQELLGVTRTQATNEIVVLGSPDLQLIVHAIPAHIAETFDNASPPTPREDAAYKFFFTVPSLADARAAAPALGGEVLAEQWRGPGFVVCNAVDPEGNIFQVRETTD